METKTFKPGDRVKVTTDLDGGIWLGRTGTVEEVSTGAWPVVVRLDESPVPLVITRWHEGELEHLTS